MLKKTKLDTRLYQWVAEGELLVHSHYSPADSGARVASLACPLGRGNTAGSCFLPHRKKYKPAMITLMPSMLYMDVKFRVLIWTRQIRYDLEIISLVYYCWNIKLSHNLKLVQLSLIIAFILTCIFP